VDCVIQTDAAASKMSAIARLVPSRVSQLRIGCLGLVWWGEGTLQEYSTEPVVRPCGELIGTGTSLTERPVRV